MIIGPDVVVVVVVVKPVEELGCVPEDLFLVRVDLLCVPGSLAEREVDMDQTLVGS